MPLIKEILNAIGINPLVGGKKESSNLIRQINCIASVRPDYSPGNFIEK